MQLKTREKGFIDYLLELAKEGHENRGALAELRSGLGKKPGEMSRIHRHVVPYLPENSRWEDRWFYLIATLFGFHPMHQGPIVHKTGDREWRSITVGNAFGELWRERDHAESIEARFIALLNVDVDDLGDHLRHAISLLKAHEKPLDWHRLFRDILKWDSQEREVQKSWARDFYKHSPDNRVVPDKQVEEVARQEV